MNLQQIRSYSFVTALLISACAPALASVTVFTDRNLWLAATSPITTLDFTGATASNGDVAIASIDLQGFDFPTSSHDLQVLFRGFPSDDKIHRAPDKPPPIPAAIGPLLPCPAVLLRDVPPSLARRRAPGTDTNPLA